MCQHRKKNHATMQFKIIFQSHLHNSIAFNIYLLKMANRVYICQYWLVILKHHSFYVIFIREREKSSRLVARSVHFRQSMAILN